MKERPILFNGEMVKAILEGRKTMTRRVVNKDISNQFDIDVDNTVAAYINQFTGDSCNPVEICPYGDVGDRLWVRETWRVGRREDPYQQYKGVQYKADELCPENEKDELPVLVLPEARDMEVSQYWRPSIFMPRWASRITLEVADIRAERLQDITEEDSKREGVPDEYPIPSVYCPRCAGLGSRSLKTIETGCPNCDTAKKRFKNLWDSINGRKPGKAWNDNPWVWVVEFRRGGNV